MRRTCKIPDGSGLFLLGVLIFILGVMAITYKPLYNEAVDQVHKSTMLLEGTTGFQVWSSTMRLYFRIYVFHVLNPEGIMQGELPKLQERGPYVYDELMNKQVIDMDEAKDEVLFTVIKNFKFNPKLSGNLTENDVVTVINPAYLGPINMLATFPPALLNQYGNHIIKLFPKTDTIFVTGKVKDLFFDGLPLVCDEKKYKELEFMCNMLRNKRPPILRENGKEGVYAYSLFHKLNGTVQGPYTLNRGSRNISQLGDITSVKGKRVTKYWANKTCNIVKGTDSITWAPMEERIPRVYTYIEEACRAMWAEYKDDVIVNGVTGWRYTLTEQIWEPEEILGYCPVQKKVPKCLPKGVLDITKCQEAPVIMSEPHFLHADPDFLRFAELNPTEEKHFTFIIIDPLTGAPLHGQKKMQLSMKLQKLPVTLLENVSEGYFPIFWCDDGGQPERSVVKMAYQAHRVINVVRFLEYVPAILGLFLMLSAFIMCRTSKKSKRRNVAWVQDSVIIPSQILSQTIVRRTPNRSKAAIE